MNREPSWLTTIAMSLCSFSAVLALGYAYIWVVGL
jgi:hypothetical protein